MDGQSLMMSSRVHVNVHNKSMNFKFFSPHQQFVREQSVTISNTALHHISKHSLLLQQILLLTESSGFSNNKHHSNIFFTRDRLSPARSLEKNLSCLENLIKQYLGEDQSTFENNPFLKFYSEVDFA